MILALMDVEAFQNALKKALSPCEPELVRAWHDWENKVPGAVERFTEVWKGENGIYDKLGQLLGLECVKEGEQRVDAVYVAPGGDTLIALEHENKISTAEREIRKLARLDVPLNVVVTYPVSRKPDEERDRYLRGFERILAGSNPPGMHMVVVGILRESSIDWSFHVFTGTAFTER